jgi:hypothetical protein
MMEMNEKKEREKVHLARCLEIATQIKICPWGEVV